MILLDRCLKLIDDGFSLITSDEDKKPNIKWKKCHEAAMSKDEFSKCYEIKSTANIGIVTGFADVECVDVDLKVFSTANERVVFWDEYLSFLKDNIFDFNDKFVIYKTKNDGYHILYKSKRVSGNSKLAKLKGHTEAVIETRGKGGYIIVYENSLTDKTYKDIHYISDEDREILWSISKTYDYVDEKVIEPEKKKIDIELGKLTPWEDYNSKTSIFDIIRPELEIVRNISDKYIVKRNGAKSPHSGYVYKNSGCMYLFSTGTIFPHEKLISPFTAYAIKYHNSDFSAAAKEIYKDGYGDRVKPKTEIEAPKSIKSILNQDNLIFPLDIFPENIKKYIITCNETLNTSIDYMGASMLWVTSVIIGNSLNVEVKKGWKEPCNLWLSLVGKAGIGKTPSISMITYPIQKVNNREIRNYIKHNDKYDQFCELSKKEKEQVEEVQKPKKSQFIVNDITLEALIDLHDENKNGIGVLKDELAGWLKEMNRYRQGSDLEHWLSSWNGNSINLNRKTSKSSFIDKAFIPVIGGIQPGVLDGFYNEENKDNGFIDRLLFCYPELTIEPYNDNEMSNYIINWFDDYIVSFFQQCKESIQYTNEGDINTQTATLSPDGKKEWIRIFNKITAMQNSDTENEYLKSMLPKQKSYIPRFALIINTIKNFDSGTPEGILNISGESMRKAEILSNYFIEMAKKIKLDSKETHEIRQVLNDKKTGSQYDIFKEIYSKNNEINKSKLSEILGVSRQTVHNYISRYMEKQPKSVKGV